MSLPQEVTGEIEAGALFVINHSAGKDSQAMLIHLIDAGVPACQMVIVHADLGEVEWPGNLDHIRRYSGNIPLIVAKAKRTLFEMIEARGMFPSPSQRQCTSDLKRGPIEREVRRHLKTLPGHSLRVVNCMGMRAQESAVRAKRSSWKFNARNSKAGRTWHDWLPIHHLTEKQVFAAIHLNGQSPHPIYTKGMTRLSCQFCIMASKGDLTTAAKLSPKLYAKYVALEKKHNHTLSMSRKGLEEITGITATQATSCIS